MSAPEDLDSELAFVPFYRLDVPQLLLPTEICLRVITHSFLPRPRIDYCASIYAGLPQVWIEMLEWVHSSADTPRPTTYPSICRRYCTGFHSHSPSHAGSLPWCCGAYSAVHPPTCTYVSFSTLFLLAQAAVPLYPRGSPFRSLCDNEESFLWFVRQPRMGLR